MTNHPTEVEKLRMALAEVGVPPEQVTDRETITISGRCTERIAWRAFRTVYPAEEVGCFDCWAAGDGEGCEHLNGVTAR